LDPAVWRTEVEGSRAFQLAIDGTSAVPILEHFAKDESFAGLVILEVNPVVDFADIRASEARAEGYLEAYRRMLSSPASRVEIFLRTHLPALVFMRPEFSFDQLRRRLSRSPSVKMLDDLLPKPSYWNRRADRHTPLDFTRIDSKLRERRLVERMQANGQPASDAELDSLIARIKRAAERIERRGGKVVAVHLPHCCDLRRAEERKYPPSTYWAAVEGALEVAIYFDDYPALNAFSCPDGSHLDRRNSPAFTRALAEIVGGHLEIAQAAEGPRYHSSSE
jgi:hypothetical protein